MDVRATRRLLWVLTGSLLAGVGPRAAAAPPDAPASGVLVLAELSDFDVLPPDLLLTPSELAAGTLVPPPKGIVVKPAYLARDWDGNGRVETTLKKGRTSTVRVPKGTWVVPLLVAERAGAWRFGPGAILRGQVAGTDVELLDADLDGRFDGEADRVRWADGAFHRPAPERRVATPNGSSRWSLAREGEAWKLTLAPEALPEGATPVQVQGLMGVNDLRNRWGLPPLTLDLAWSEGCRKHAEYIRLNPKDGFGHDEIAGRPGYTDEGRTAAVEGVMERTAEPAYAAFSLTSMMLHRTPFLCDPGTPLGVGAVGAPSNDPVLGLGKPGFCVLRAGKALASKAFPVLVPGPGQRDVPLAIRAETPTPENFKAFYDAPHGYPVSVGFLPGTDRAPRLALRIPAKNQVVDSVVFTPAQPVHSAFAHNYACAFLVALKPLEPGTTYEAECGLGEGSAARTYVWRFTTTR